jgi:4-hydroxy 2-oxovalerate aldolase
MSHVEYHDLSMRDGNHAIAHQLTLDTLEKYCTFAEEAGLAVVEVGHGNGLGASSILIGESLLSDNELITVARRLLKRTKLSVHIIPGLATISRDIASAIDLGVDIFRVACHCTEATVTKTHIEYLAGRNLRVLGVLMMAATCSTATLVGEASKMKSYGATGIVIMDSTGSLFPADVTERVAALRSLDLPIGFHAHNNMHLAVANSLAAIDAGATIIDVTLRGFGAGAGNTPLEIMASLAPDTRINMDRVLQFCDEFAHPPPVCKPVNVLTAKHKLFSGFERRILEACTKHGISLPRLVEEMAAKKLVAGQEDLLWVIAKNLAAQK